MRREGFAFQFGVELDADEPGMVLPFDDFGQAAVGAHAGKGQSAGLELVAVLDVDLIAVAVAFLDGGGPIHLGHL